MQDLITPTAKQKSIFYIHAAIFVIVNAIIWYTWSLKATPADGFKYPWAIWLTSAWALSLLGHGTSVFKNYTDKGYDKFIQDCNN